MPHHKHFPKRPVSSTPGRMAVKKGQMPTKILEPKLLLSTQQQEDKLSALSTKKSVKVQRWLPTEKDVLKMYKEKFSQMKKIAIENRMEVFHTLKFLQRYNFALLEENMLLREMCNRRISSQEKTSSSANFIDNVDADQAEVTRNMTIPPAVPSFSVKITKKKAKRTPQKPRYAQSESKRHRRIVGSSDVHMINYFVPFRPSSRIKSAGRRRQEKKCTQRRQTVSNTPFPPRRERTMYLRG